MYRERWWSVWFVFVIKQLGNYNKLQKLYLFDSELFSTFTRSISFLRISHQNVSVHPSLGTLNKNYQTDCYEIWYWRILLKSVNICEFKFRYDKNNGRYTNSYSYCVLLNVRWCCAVYQMTLLLNLPFSGKFSIFEVTPPLFDYEVWNRFTLYIRTNTVYKLMSCL